MFVYTLHARSDFWISQQKRLSRFSMGIHMSGAQYSLWKTDKFVFIEVWSRDSFFWRDKKVNSSCYWRCVLSNMPKRKVCSPFNQQNFQFFRLSVKSANLSLTCWMFLFRTKNRQLCCFVVMVHIALQQKRVVSRRKTISIFKEVFPPITIKNTGNWTIKGKNHYIYGKIALTPHSLIQLTQNSLAFSFITLLV